MRLLNTKTLQIVEFLGRNIPEYVILSHTWGDEEVIFQDVQQSKVSEKKGYAKIQGFCKKAAEDGFQYGWVDTCCIDKTSSAELSEAINSMYNWYKGSRICYAYLADFEMTVGGVGDHYRGFIASRWWSRGWTLQELLAPETVEFYDSNWNEVGTKLSLQDQIAEITGIDRRILGGADPFGVNVAVRMSWAAQRETTRIEDQAYCLMGLFRVNMPLLYGEGKRAFLRLQEEIMRIREDYTLFVWSASASTRPSQGLLAESPADFTNIDLHEKSLPHTLSLADWGFRDLNRDCSAVFPQSTDHDPPSLTSRGVRISMPIVERNSGEVYGCITLLNNTKSMVCVALRRVSAHKAHRYMRRPDHGLIILPTASFRGLKYKSIYVTQPDPIPDETVHQCTPAPSLILTKLDSTHGIPWTCYLSSWISLERLLVDGFGYGPSSGSQSSADDTHHNNSPSGNLYKYRIQRLVNALGNALVSFDPYDLLPLVMGTPPKICWLTDVKNQLYQAEVQGVLGFGLRTYAEETAFLVYIGLSEDRPKCSVVQETLDTLTDDTKSSVILEEAKGVSLHQDRATLLLRTDESEPDIEILVGIRRVASALFGVRRFVLSISQRIIPPPMPHQQQTEDSGT